ncbi:hypothetical protein [Fontibacillus panacisegetis]|uniref:hypothetical protein n=1 Tax=Fontibacillus panacisegetis TaxID=670482 RepID=UPI000B88D09C|nr:hypothetical protein [Fontibacillus panacisegetis]
MSLKNAIRCTIMHLMRGAIMHLIRFPGMYMNVQQSDQHTDQQSVHRKKKVLKKNVAKENVAKENV